MVLSAGVVGVGATGAGLVAGVCLSAALAVFATCLTFVSTARGDACHVVAACSTGATGRAAWNDELGIAGVLW